VRPATAHAAALVMLTVYLPLCGEVNTAVYRKESMRKIALEEHFMSPGLEEYWRPTMADVPPKIFKYIYPRLTNFGALRLRDMDGAGIEMVVLSIAGPGVQVERDARRATAKAAEANDFLADKVAKHPDRLQGFAHIALQDPAAAAAELERCVKQLGFKGAMINGHTLGHYLDERQFDPFWAKAEELRTWIYLHPADPVQPYASFGPYKELTRSTWGWGVETGTHALRMVFGGVFDRFPKAQLLLGHLGETLPYLLWRLDSRAKLYGVKLKKEPSQYIRDNIAVTLSGMYSAEPLNCAIAALGASRVMFSADYPFESITEAGHFMDHVTLPKKLREDIAWKNARRLLALSAPGAS
jgi:2,3-dihydroxybenzoate decarboxylase